MKKDFLATLKITMIILFRQINFLFTHKKVIVLEQRKGQGRGYINGKY